MSERRAKRQINMSDDYLLFTVVKGKMYVNYKSNASLNIIGDMAAANKDFKKYLEEIINAINNHESGNETNTDIASTD